MTSQVNPATSPLPASLQGLVPARPPGLTDIARSLGGGTTRAFHRGQLLTCEGAPCEQVFEVLTGAVKLYTVALDGRLQIMAFALPGDYIGLLDQEQYDLTAETTVPSSVRIWPRVRVDRMIDQDSRLARRILVASAQEISRTRRQMLVLGRKGTIERLASFLLLLQDRQRSGGRAQQGFFLPMSRRDMADYLGLSTETVSRGFTRLRTLAIIATPKSHRVEIRDRRALSHLAEGLMPPGALATH